MAGGAGNDYYIVDSVDDVISESSGTGTGTDSVLVNISGTMLADNIEWLVLDGLANIGFGNNSGNTLVGNTSGSQLTGNGGNDSLFGDTGSDTLEGTNDQINGVGEIDTLTGGAGADEFRLGSGFSGVYYSDGNSASAGNADYALITDFNSAEDTLVLYGEFSNYSLAATTGGLPVGTGLFLTSGTTPELIAIIQGAISSSDLASPTIVKFVS